MPITWTLDDGGGNNFQNTGYKLYVDMANHSRRRHCSYYYHFRERLYGIQVTKPEKSWWVWIALCGWTTGWIQCARTAYDCCWLGSMVHCSWMCFRWSVQTVWHNVRSMSIPAECAQWHHCDNRWLLRVNGCLPLPQLFMVVSRKLVQGCTCQQGNVSFFPVIG